MRKSRALLLGQDADRSGENAMQITVNTQELQFMVTRLKLVGKNSEKNRVGMFRHIGLIVLKLAKNYSPMSMSKTQYVSTLKGRIGKGGKRLPKKTKRRVFSRGSLKESIQMEFNSEQASIYVPSNSKAGKYAEKMHDEKGKTWRNLSIGKQPQSTDKYIEKAAKDSEKEYMKAVDKYVTELIRGI
jgi:hypothetical protein